MKQFSSSFKIRRHGGWIAVLAVFGLLGQAEWQLADAKHKPKHPNDVPGLELPIFASISAMGYAGYTYLKSRK